MCDNPMMLVTHGGRLGAKIIYCGICGKIALNKWLDSWVQKYGSLGTLPDYDKVKDAEAQGNV